MKMKNNLTILYTNKMPVSFKHRCITALLMVLLFSPSVMAQNKPAEKSQHVFSGYVLDAHSQKPVAAAQITVADKSASAITNDQGRFSLKTSARSVVLIVSAYDYNSREIAVRSEDSIVVKLYSDQFSNYFRKVNGLNGAIDNSRMISATKSVENIKNSSAITIDELIQTELGADARAVNRSAVAGVGSSLFIRGINSLNANAQPLFVVDGVIWNSFSDVSSIHTGFFSNPLDVIEMSDIESISVVKDGAGIYGSKAANGVVMIKTRRSTSEVTKIGLNIFSGVTMAPSSIPMMSGEQFRLYASDMLNSKSPVGNDVSGYGFLESNPSNVKIYNTNHNNTNWADEVYQQGTTNNYIINADGGDDKAKYYFSLGHTNNKGVVKTTDMQRYSIRLNADIKMNTNFDLGLNIGYSRIERSLADDGVDKYYSPTWAAMTKAPFLSPYNYTSAGELTYDYANADEFGVGNPSGMLKYAVSNLIKNRFNLGVLPSLKITPELTLSSQIDYNLTRTTEGRFIPVGFTASRIIPEQGVSDNMINNQVIRNQAIFDDTRLTFEKSIDKSNHIKALLGWRYVANYFESDYVEEHNTKLNMNTTINGTRDFKQAYGLNNWTKSISNYASVDYNFENKYFLSATAAIDGSSRFGTKTADGFQLFGRSWGVFPSVNAAWILSSEDFMRNQQLIDFCKVRAGFGVTGNDGMLDYQSMAYFLSVRYMDKANGLVISNLENTSIQWETTGKLNAGIDLSLLDNRLSLSLDYFNSNTSNLLVQKELPIITGLAKYWDNDGKLNNHGFELSANVKVFNFKNLKWELGASLGHYTNQITELNAGSFTTQVYGGEVISKVGESVGSFYGYKTMGVFSTQAEAEAAGLEMKNADGSISEFGAGDIIFEDKVPDGIIDENDKQIIGNPNPDFYGTITNKFSYKRFTLNTIFTYSYGNDVYNYFRSQLEAGKDFSNQTTIMNTRWTANGQVTEQPKAVYGDPMGNARFSDRWIEDGSYLRLKTVTLSYDLPIKSKFIEGVNLWVSANNLLTFTNYLGQDPEFSVNNSVFYQGVDAGMVPQTKSYYVGVKFNL